MTSETPDRLRIFVSSTIDECSEERAVVREAIHSINHDPVLFEKIGARPHPPRVVYKARLEMSQIFIGIYRESYGWVAPDMEISGIEDEFLIATEKGLDRLIYVFRKPTFRDSRLKNLIERVKNAGLVFAKYSTAEELRERVRNDVTAVISGRFVDQAIASSETATAHEVLESLLPNQAHRLRRRAVEANLIQALQKGGRLLVNAPLGGGKTVLAAQLAADNDWIFIDGQGLSRLDLLARVANVVRQRLGQRAITLSSEQSAAQELLAGLESLGDATLVVDGAEDPMILWTLPVKKWRMLLTSRPRLEVPIQLRFEIPPLDREEIAAWVGALRGARPEPGELVGLAERSGGSPLYLRFYALGGSSSSDLSLRELEVRAVQSLPSRTREITSYVALSSRPLSLKDLQALAGSDKGPEDIAEQVAMAGGLISQTHGHVQLVHEHLRATLLDQLRQSPTRLAFFASRLGRHFEQSERFVAAFHAYFGAGELRHVNRLLTKAAHQAMLMGGGGSTVAIFRRQADVAREKGDIDEQINALLALASALKQTGASAEVAQVLASARLAAPTRAIIGSGHELWLQTYTADHVREPAVIP